MSDISGKELQKYELGVLRSIDAFCRGNNIQYSLFFGTLLGAVRHNGFIPWDDDVDIAMPREDYERFISSFKAENCVVRSQKDDPDWPFGFAKCMDMRLLVDEHLRGCAPFGAYVDVFPIDGLPDDKRKIHGIYRTIHRHWIILEFGRWPARKKGEKNLFKIAARFLLMNFLWLIRKPTMTRLMKDARKYRYDISKYIGIQVLGTYGEKNCLEREKLGAIKDIYFEDGVFRAFEGVDYFLKHIYGDYMELPPIEKRVVHSHDLKWNDENPHNNQN